MSRIRFDKLPPLEELTPEEQRELYGAGPRKAVLGFDWLEGRDLMAGGLLGGAVLPTPSLAGATLAESQAAQQDITTFVGARGGVAYGIDRGGHLERYTDAEGWREIGGAAAPVVKALAVNPNAIDQVFAQGTDNTVYTLQGDALVTTGRKLVSMKTGQGTLYGCDITGNLYVYQSRTKLWQFTGINAKAFSVGVGDRGGDMVLAQTKNNLVWSYAGPGKWVSTGAYLTTFQVGQGEAFGLNAARLLYRYTPSTGWKPMGQYGKALAIGQLTPNGQDLVFLQKTDNTIIYFQGTWKSTGKALTQIQAAKGQLFGLDATGALWRFDAVQRQWTNTGKAGTFVIGTDARGLNEVYLRDAHNTMWDYEGGDWKMAKSGSAGSSTAATKSVASQGSVVTAFRDNTGCYVADTNIHMLPAGVAPVWTKLNYTDLQGRLIPEGQAGGIWSSWAADGMLIQWVVSLEATGPYGTAWAIVLPNVRQNPPPTPTPTPAPVVAKNQTEPVCATNYTSRSVIVWTQEYSGQDTDIKVQVFQNGQAVTNALTVAEKTIPESNPAVAIDSHGNFIVVWVENYNGDKDVKAQRFDANGNRMGGIIAVATGYQSEEDPSVAMIQPGKFIISYTDTSTVGGQAHGNVRCKIYTATTGDAFSVQTFAVPDDGLQSHSSQVVTNGWTGEFALAYQIHTADGWLVAVQTFDANGATRWLKTANVDGFCAAPSIAMDNQGHMVLAYQKLNSFGNWDIAGRWIDRNGTFGTEMLLAANTSKHETRPTVALHANNGNWVVAYNHDENRGIGITSINSWSNIATNLYGNTVIDPVSVSVDSDMQVFLAYGSVVDNTRRVTLFKFEHI